MAKHASNERFDASPKTDSINDKPIASQAEELDEFDRMARPEAGGAAANPVADNDERIGLTEAFAPVSSGKHAKGDTPIGLTEAFAPVSEGAHAGGFNYQGDADGEYPDALESLEPADRPPLLADDDSLVRDLSNESVEGRHGSEPAVPAYQHKSRKLRRMLIVVIVILLVLLVAAAVATFMLVRTASDTAVQIAASSQTEAVEELTSIDDSSATATKLVTAPDLGSLLGMTEADAVAAIGRGATVTSSQEVNEEGSSIRTNVTYALTDEPGDSRSGTPSVYLSLNEEGVVVQAGYSAATSSLGYGSLSFTDAVTNEHIVEKTLQEAGIPVEEGVVALPEDKAQYSTYDSDGTTLVRENCSFNGEVDLNGATRTWSATLSYDYTSANASDNLANTIRLIYVYVGEVGA